MAAGHGGVFVPGDAERTAATRLKVALEALDDFPERVCQAQATTDGNTGYTLWVAKVMVSLPDDLLTAVDIEARRRGTTRSGFLRELAEETLQRRSTRRAERMTEIDEIDGPLSGRGGHVSELVKATRPER